MTEKKKETTINKKTVATEKKNIVQKKKTVNTEKKTTNRTKKTDKQTPKRKTINGIKTVVGDVQPSTSELSKKGGPIPIDYDTGTESLSDEVEYRNDEKCCVCGLFDPK